MICIRSSETLAEIQLRFTTLDKRCAVPHIGNTEYKMFQNMVEETAETPLNKIQSTYTSVLRDSVNANSAIITLSSFKHLLLQLGLSELFIRLGHCFKCRRRITLLYDPDSYREICRTWRMLEYMSS